MTSLGRTASSLHHNSVLGHKSLTPKGNPLSRVSHPPPRIPLPCQGPNPLPGDTMGLRAPPPRGPQKAGSFKRAWPHVTAVTHPTEGGQERAGGGGGASPSERVVASHWPSRSANGKRPSGTPTFGGTVAAGQRAAGQWERALCGRGPMDRGRGRAEGRRAYKKRCRHRPPPQCRAPPGREGGSDRSALCGTAAMSRLSLPVALGALLALAAAGPTQFFREEFGDGGEGGGRAGGALGGRGLR